MMIKRIGRIEKGPGWELRLGDYREVLEDVQCDAVITDPPYSERTHSGHDGTLPTQRSAICYASWDENQIWSFTQWTLRTCRGWVCAMHDHAQRNTYEEMLSPDRYVFAPLPIVDKGSRVRLMGDGPSSWCVWMTVARPRKEPYSKWGTLPGAYIRQPRDERSNHTGGKPLGIMRAIVRDYSRKGDLICDPCAGGGTTILAAVMEGRRAIGAEVNEETFDKSVARLRKGYTTNLPGVE